MSSKENTSSTSTSAFTVTMQKRNAFYAPYHAECVYAVDVSGLDRDTLDMLRTLQGLVARYDSGAVYLIADDADRFWKTYAEKEMGVYFREVTAEKLISQFSKWIRGVVLYTADTYEYEMAFNTAMQEDAVIATEAVMRKYALAAKGRITDLRGAYTDKKTAYSELLTRAGGAYLYLAGDNLAFADYAYALHAPLLRLSEQEMAAWFPLLERATAWRGVIFTDDDLSAWTKTASASGYGLLQVKDFANATFFSSATTSKKYTAKAIAKPTAAATNKAYVTFVVQPSCLSDTLRIDTDAWGKQSGEVPVSYEFSLALCELAPCVLMWYDNAAIGSSRLIGKGWCDISQQDIAFDAYQKWNATNNAMLSLGGFGVVSTASLREDSVFGENFGDSTTAAGVVITDNSGTGLLFNSGRKPTAVSVNFRTLSALDAWLASVVNVKNPLYYAVAVTSQAFAETVSLTGDTDSTSFTQLVQSHAQKNSLLKPVAMEALLGYGLSS